LLTLDRDGGEAVGAYSRNKRARGGEAAAGGEGNEEEGAEAARWVRPKGGGVWGGGGGWGGGGVYRCILF